MNALLAQYFSLLLTLAVRMHYSGLRNMYVGQLYPRNYNLQALLLQLQYWELYLATLTSALSYVGYVASFRPLHVHCVQFETTISSQVGFSASMNN